MSYGEQVQKKNLTAKIDDAGRLWLKDTHGELGMKHCPFGSTINLCGDNCPHFSVTFPDNYVRFELCHGKVIEVLKSEFEIEE